MKTRSLTIVFSAALLGAGFIQSAVSQAPAVDPTTQAQAERAAKVFDEIETDHWSGNPTPKTHRLDEADLNAFLAREVRLQAPRGVEKVAVDLKADDVFVTYLTVDLDHVELPEQSAASSLMLTLFGGKQNLDVEGRLKSADGAGTYEVLGARLNGIPLPASVVASLLRAVGRNLEPPFDPTAPFHFSYGIQRVQISADRATIFTDATRR